MPRWSGNITQAIKCGYVPKCRTFDAIVKNPQTRGEQVIAFAYHYLKVPEGMHTGEPLRLLPFQICFILAVVDNPHGTRNAYLSVARRNGKTFLTSLILLSYIIGPLARRNTTIASGAMSRDQSGLCYNIMSKMLMMNPELSNLYRAIPSKKQIVGLNQNVTYTALASDAKTGYGQSLFCVLLDEAGQIQGPTSDFTDMLQSSQGSFDDSLMLTISTQAPSDSDYLSVLLDQAEMSGDKHTISHVYSAPADCDLMDRKYWRMSNPGLGKFRSEKDLREQLKLAKAIPAKEGAARNLLTNARIAQENLFCSPDLWLRNSGEIDLDVFRDNRVVMGLDLSKRSDLTSAVISAKDPDTGLVHVKDFTFCPRHGIEARSARDRTPYASWVQEGSLIPIGGETQDYDQISAYLRDALDDLDITLDLICFDRWGIENYQASCSRTGLGSEAEWESVGQGYASMGSRTDCLLNALLEARIRHGKSPLLTMAAANAVAVADPTGAIKLDKRKSTQRIDPLVAMLMSVFPLLDAEEGEGSYLDDASEIMMI